MKPHAPHVERILVIRRHNHVGDMLCSLPLYAALHKRWPAARIDLLATPTRYPIPLKALNPYIDSVTYYTKGSLGEILRAHRSLRRMQYDMALVPSTVALSRTSHITAFVSGAPLRVGVRAIDGTVNSAWRLLTVSGDVAWNGRQVHQEDRNREIAAFAGCVLDDEEVRALRIPLNAHADEAAAAALGPYADGRPLLGVHPGAGKRENIWAAERFASVLELSRLPEGTGVVITGSTLDEAEIAALSGWLDKKGISHRILRNLEISVLSAVFRRLRAYLSNDTGTMHIAAYSGCPTVSLFGPTHAWEWAPRGSSHRAVQSPDRSMNGITVPSVVEALSEVITDGK